MATKTKQQSQPKEEYKIVQIMSLAEPTVALVEGDKGQIEVYEVYGWALVTDEDGSTSVRGLIPARPPGIAPSNLEEQDNFMGYFRTEVAMKVLMNRTKALSEERVN